MPRLVTVALVLLGLIAPAASAAPTAGPVFDLPAKPGYLHGTADGGAWVAVNSTDPFDVVRIEPDGAVLRYALTGVQGTTGVTTAPGGDVWLTATNAVVHFTPGAPTVPPATTAVTAVPVPGLSEAAIAVGPDGNLWTASGSVVRRITPAGVVTPFAIAGTTLKGIVAGPDALYVADFDGTIVKITTDGVVTQLPAKPGMQQVAIDATGNLAATQPVFAPQVIQLRTPALQEVTTTIDPFGIVAAPDGAFWVAGFASTSLLRVTPDGATSTLPIGAAANDPRQLAVAGQGRLYVGLEASQKVQRVDGVTAPVAPQPAPAPGGGAPTPTPAPTPPGPAAKPTVRASARGLRRPGRPVVRVTSSVAGRATVVLERRAAGRRKGRRCVARSSARTGKRCVRWVRVTRATANVAAGTAKSVRFGRVGAGRYRFRVSVAAAGVTVRRTVTLRIRG